MIPPPLAISPLAGVCLTSIASASALDICATALAARAADSRVIRRHTAQPRSYGAYLGVRRHSSLRYVHPRYERRMNQPVLLSITKKNTSIARGSYVPVISRAEFWHRACRRKRAEFDRWDLKEERKMFEEKQQFFKEKLERMNQRRDEMLKNLDSQDMDWNKWSQWTKESVKDMKKDMKSARKELLRKRLEFDPYDALFGWSNRLRKGLPPEVWVWGDVLQRKHDKKTQENTEQDISTESPRSNVQPEQPPVAQSQNSDPVNERPSSKAGSFPRAVPIEVEEIPNQPGSRNKDGVLTMPVPDVESTSKDYILEYDPISHRMVKKSSEEFSHYGQDLDTSSNVPMEPREQLIPTESITDPNQSTIEPTQPVDPDVVLRQAFEKWKAERLAGAWPAAHEDKTIETKEVISQEEKNHSLSNSNITQEFKPENSLGNTHTLTSDAQNTVPPQNPQMGERLRDLSDKIQTLGERVSRLQPSLESARQSQGERNFGRTKEELTSPVKEEVPSNASPISFRQLNTEPTTEQNKPPQLDPEANSMPIGKETRAINQAKSNNFRRKVEIEKLKEHIATLDRSFPGGHTPEALAHRQKLKNEIFRLKREREPMYSVRPSDQSKIETEDRKEPVLEETRPLDQGRVTSMENKKPVLKEDHYSSSKQQVTPPKSSENVVYTILAYDPSTSEVSSTNISAPAGTAEERIPLTEALTRLSEPAKFLPHLRLLKDEGFIAVTATKNMLVLRGSAQQNQSSEVVTGKSVSEDARTLVDSSSLGSTEVSRPSQSSSDPRPKRLEDIYTGPEREYHRTKGQHKQGGRWFWRAAIATGVASTVIYVGGLNSGMRRVSVPSEVEKENFVISRR